MRNQLRDTVFVGVEQLIGILELQVVFDAQVQKGIEPVFAALFGNLGHALADHGLHGGIPNLMNDGAFPFAREYLGRLHLFAECRPKGFIPVEFLLLLNRLVKGRLPTGQIGKNEGFAQVDLNNQRTTGHLRNGALLEQWLNRAQGIHGRIRLIVPVQQGQPRDLTAAFGQEHVQ